VSDKGFVSLKSLSGKAPSSPAQILEEIRGIYFRTTKQTIDNDFAHAIELLKSLPDEDTRERATVFMEGIAQMRRDWSTRKEKGKRQKETGERKKVKGKR
jgi:hypothetical protein